MKKIYTILSILLLTSSAFAQNDVEVSASDSWIAYMTVFETPANGGGYLFGSGWGVSDAQTTLDVGANTVTLQPNFNGYANSLTGAPGDIDFWTNSPDGGITPGPLGNKLMEASTFAESDVTFNGSDLTFHGDVLANTLDPAYTASFFIKALDPANGYSDALGGAKIFPIPASGPFTVSATGAELAAGLVVQYGFTVEGINANPLNEAALGSIVIGVSDVGLNDFNSVQTNVYPNPASNELFISSEFEVVNFTIVNLAGQTVLEGEMSKADISVLETGSYVIHIATEQGVSVKRFIKK